jgi:hypothetical protein
MRAVVVYESMFGNTHEVAERIAAGLGGAYEVEVISVGEAIAQILPDLDLIVVGGPTHAHGMSRHGTRAAATEQAAKDPELDIEEDAGGPGLRDWFHGLGPDHGTAAAAFDTRVDGPAFLTGSAAKGIGKQLEKHGFRLVDEPESFLVDKQNHLLAGEADRAMRWGEALAIHASTAVG